LNSRAKRQASKGHRKQHFVPVCYLKAWCDPNTPKSQTPYVWIFDKDGTNARRKAPENILHETDMYTVKMPGGDRDLVLERGLQQLETEFSRIRKHKLKSHCPLDKADHFLLCAFIAATHARTRAMREHQKEQWERPLRMMEKMMKWAETATPEQKEQAATIVPPGTSDPGLDYHQVKALCENPIPNMLIPSIQTVTPLLCRLNFTIFETDDDIGFITSDNPCFWFDAEAYKRPPLYQSPALIYESIEITLPVSPHQCICLHRRDSGISAYIKATPLAVDELNKRTRFSTDQHFIVCSNETKTSWFQPGVEPDDSRDKLHAKKNVSEAIDS
jgi:hypothetical protein